MTVRSLTSGVNGMLTNQLTMDVSANNVANANTPGFKGSRVNFSNNLVQTLTSGSAPGDRIGGRNPTQVGLGVQASSIEVNMGQGALQATGRNLDLAVQGEGFFEITDGVRNFYTRVGNLGLDANNDLVHLGTGFRVVGNTFNLGINPDGSQNVNEVGVPINVPVNDAFPPSRTEEVVFQGNLSSESRALRGTSLQSLFQLRDQITGSVASETTLLRNLNTFTADTVGDPNSSINLWAFGTQPNGQTFAGTFELHPWRTPTATDNRGGVGEMVEKINEVLSQGGSRFGTVRIENGNLVATGVGDGTGFSLFLGEGGSPFNLSALNVANPGAALNGNLDGIPLAGVNVIPADGANTLRGTFTDTTPVGNLATYTAPEDPTPVGAPVEGRGLIDPMFFPAPGILDRDMVISVKINTAEIGVITIPQGDYSGVALEDRVFRLTSFPHIEPGDVITYDLVNTGNDLAATNINFITYMYADANENNLTADASGPNNTANGLPDMFEEGSPIDPNAWQYENETNLTMKWYRQRMVPEFASSSIEVFDAQGGSHILEARFFRTGTRTDPANGARFNSWDMVVGIGAGEGILIDDLVTGIEFDQQGRYTGNVGTTVHGTALNESSYVGNPAVNSIQIDWAATGPTDPANIRINLGQPSSFGGLTGFGSQSNASAVNQDGFSDGLLDSISVSSEGRIVALYTNGIGRALAQLVLSTFRNPSGLVAAEGNLWRQSTNSGNPTRRIPGQNSGIISSGALEGSNVDIATEFSRMIIAQRGFQVNARVIQTTDSMLEELSNLLR